MKIIKFKKAKKKMKFFKHQKKLMLRRNKLIYSPRLILKK